MPPFVRRPSALASLFASFSLLTVVACSSSDEAAPSTPDASSAPQPESDAGPAPESNDVVVYLDATFGHSDGNITRRKNPWTTEATITAPVDGKPTTFTSTTRDDGARVFVGVPRAAYVLELRKTYTGAKPGDPPIFYSYPIDGARIVQMDEEYWPRQEVTAFDDDTTKLALSITAPAGIEEGDTFSWIGLHSYFYREHTFNESQTEGSLNLPTAGSTTSSNWTMDGSVLGSPYGPEASGLPVVSAKDDLLILQNRARYLAPASDPSDPLARFNPYARIRNNEVIGELDVDSPNFANGTTNTVTGTLHAPVTEHLTIDFDGTTYATIREAGNYPKTATASIAIALTQEAGPGPGVFTSVAPTSWALSASSKKKPVDLSCFPYEGSTTCDPGSCAIGCANATDGYIDPGKLEHFEFDAPRVYATGMRDFYGSSYAFSLKVTLPDTTDRTLTASVSDARPRETDHPSFGLELGPPLNIVVDGQTLPWTIATIADDHAPVVAFTAATDGAPDYSRVELIDLTPDGAETERARTFLLVATLNTHESSVTLPKDSLRSGHTYYLRVSSVKDGWNFHDRAARSKALRTTVFTPPFVYGGSAM